MRIRTSKPVVLTPPSLFGMGAGGLGHDPSPKRRGEHGRPGFTLVELIIVIAIIAILAAITTGVVMRFYGIQQQRNTEVTITKAYEVLKRQWDQVVSDANQEQPISPQAMALAGGPGNEAQARVIHIKLRLKQEFPMDFNEIANPYPTDLPPLQMYKDAIAAMPANAGITIATPRTITPTENATCLYLALQRSRGGTAFNFDNLGSNAVATDSSGLQKWIVDGWRMPIIYYRWATANDELDQSNPAAQTSTQGSYRDPQDPTGALLNASWWIANHNWTPTNPVWTPFENRLHSLFKFTPPTNPTWSVGPFPYNSGPFPNRPPPALPLPYTIYAYEYYTVPVIASAGPNKNFGLVFPNLTPDPNTGTCFSVPNPMLSDNTGDDADNIYSYRLRLGARGD